MVDSPSGRGTVLLPLSIAIGPGSAYTPGLMWFEDELSLDDERVPRMPDLLIRVDDALRPGRLAVRCATLAVNSSWTCAATADGVAALFL